MNKMKMQKLNVGELLVGQEYHSHIRNGWGEILEAKLRGDVHFPNGYVFAIKVSTNHYNPKSEQFWATVSVVA